MKTVLDSGHTENTYLPTHTETKDRVLEAADGDIYHCMMCKCSTMEVVLTETTETCYFVTTCCIACQQSDPFFTTEKKRAWEPV